MIVTGVITEITDSNKPSKNGKPPIYKQVATIDSMDGQSVNVEFFKEQREMLLNGFKINDKVQVEYQMVARKNRYQKTFNNATAVSIKRI